MEKAPLKLPKLKTRDELLRTAPELGRLLAAGDAESTAALPGRVPSPLKVRPRSSPSKRAINTGRLVRKFTDEEMTEEERVRVELEKVKAERAKLLTSLARLRADTGKSGGELQQEDIRLLRRELEAKQDKLNELRRATRELTDTLDQLETTSRDCDQLMPQAMEGLVARAETLSGELAGVEQDILEAEAKHELYKLLEIRTRRDHGAAQQHMREARALKEGAGDDYTTLTKQMHEMRAAKEDAERELGATVMMYDQVRSDWSKKLKDRRKEVRELERRRSEDEKRKVALEALAAEKARLEQEKVDKNRTDKEAATLRLSAVVPELEMLEATWARLHGVCSAATAEDVIQYWQDLKAKEASMRELVQLAEVREARAKREMAALLAERAEVFDTETAQGEQRQRAVAEMEAAVGELLGQETRQQGAAAATEVPAQVAAEPGLGGAATGDVPEATGSTSLAEPAGDAAVEGEAADAAGLDTQSDPAQDVGAAAKYAVQELAARSAAEEAAGATREPAPQTVAEVAAEMKAEPAAAASSAPFPAAPAAPAAPVARAPDMEELLREKQAQIADARRRKKAAKEKFAKLSQVCVAAEQGLQLLTLRLKTAMDPTGDGGTRSLSSLHDGRRLTSFTADDRRSSVGGRRTTSLNRRTTGQMAMRVSAAGLIERRASITLLPAPAAGPVETPPRQPQGAFIHNKDFFPELHSMLGDVGSHLDRLMRLVGEMETAEAVAKAADAAAAAVAAAAEQRALTRRSDVSSELSVLGVEEESGGSGEPAGQAVRVPSKKLQWADGQPTPRVPGTDESGEEEGSVGEGGVDSDADPEAAAAAAQGEKSLRKGFRRRTWAGPAWLNAVSAGKPLTATLRKMTASRSKPGGTPAAGGRGTIRGGAQLALRRIVGYVEEPSSDGEGGNPFVLSSSEDEVEEDGVVDRQYLKHRAHKLTNPRVRGKVGAGVGCNSPSTQVDVR